MSGKRKGEVGSEPGARPCGTRVPVSSQSRGRSQEAFAFGEREWQSCPLSQYGLPCPPCPHPRSIKRNGEGAGFFVALCFVLHCHGSHQRVLLSPQVTPDIACGNASSNSSAGGRLVSFEVAQNTSVK